MAEHNILIVDDEEWMRNQLKWGLSTEGDIFLAHDTDSAKSVINKSSPDLIMLDISLTPDIGSGTEGIDLLRHILNLDATIKVIMITGNDTRENALKCIAMGAYDFYSKPVNMEELKLSAKRALYIQSLERENKKLLEDLEQTRKNREIVSDCKEMEKVLEVIRRVSATEATVLIRGESGTGKELVARAMHYGSPRKDEPFVPINCGAIPADLLESELFGHEKGAFTSAHAQKKGKLELANKGTVFLDEIAELTPALQVKILRFLQDKKVERLGGKAPIQLDVRILAATNKDIEKAIDEEDFRSDLYYRLNVISISLPPLRERGDDIMLLARVFLKEFNREMSTNISGFSDEAISALMSYDWPGNVRELENKIRRAVIMAEGAYIRARDLDLEPPDQQESDLNQAIPLKEMRARFESRYICESLRRTNGNVTHASELIDVERTTLHSLISKYGIEPGEYGVQDESDI